MKTLLNIIYKNDKYVISILVFCLPYLIIGNPFQQPAHETSLYYVLIQSILIPMLIWTIKLRDTKTLGIFFLFPMLGFIGCFIAPIAWIVYPIMAFVMVSDINSSDYRGLD